MIKNLLVILFVVVLAACSDSQKLTVDMAEADYMERHYDSARDICNELVNGDNFDRLSIDQLCRLSVLLVKLSDCNDEDSDIALAAKCMQEAMNRNADSVRFYVEAMPVDERSQSVLIQQLITAIESPVDPATLYQHADSIPNDSI